MDDLCCARCGRVAIAGFWRMVARETEHTFAHLSLECPCGARIEVEIEAARRPPRGAGARPRLRVPGLSSISAA